MKEPIEVMQERISTFKEMFKETNQKYWLGKISEAEYILEKLKALQNSEHDKNK